MIPRLLFLGGVSAGLCFLVTWIVLRVARARQWFDVPDARKIHEKSIPRLGGVAVVISSFIAFGVAGWLFREHVRFSRNVFLLYLPAVIIVFLGIFDDLKGANAVQKFFFQIVSAIIVYHLSFSIKYVSLPLIGSFHLGFLSPFVTVLWIVFVINAFNLIDGLDGLLVRIALYASISLGVIFFMRHRVPMVVLTVVIIGVLAGFLPWNLHPARIFLGDTGSMFLGFLFAVFSMASSQKNPLSMSLLVPVMIILIPLADTSWAFVRRVRQGQSPFKADQLHLHHHLMKLFGSHKRASFVLSSLSGAFSAVGIVASMVNVRYRPILLLASVGLCVACFRKWHIKAQ